MSCPSCLGLWKRRPGEPAQTSCRDSWHLRLISAEDQHKADHYLAAKYGTRCPGCGEAPTRPTQETDPG